MLTIILYKFRFFSLGKVAVEGGELVGMTSAPTLIGLSLGLKLIMLLIVMFPSKEALVILAPLYIVDGVTLLAYLLGCTFLLV